MNWLNLGWIVEYLIAMQTEMIRKTLGKPRDLTAFERVRRLNAELDRLGIKRDQEDHLVRKIFGRSRLKS